MVGEHNRDLDMDRTTNNSINSSSSKIGTIEESTKGRKELKPLKIRCCCFIFFRVLKLFLSIGTDVVKHYNTMEVHRSFPQGVVS